MSQSVDEHCAEIHRCNQRGGRMLSVVDLLDAGTLTPDLAAYALAAIGGGGGFLVGAKPGGAGKTTVMGALLNFVPADVALRPADGPAAIDSGIRAPEPRTCFICHEIGSGPWYAYLWGADLRAYFRLPDAGHMLATNLHADTYEQAREQICGDNRVPPEHLRRMHMMFFLAVGRGLRTTRRIVTAWESDGREDHRQVYDGGDGVDLSASSLVDADALSAARARIDELAASDARTIEDVRAALTAPGA